MSNVTRTHCRGIALAIFIVSMTYVSTQLSTQVDAVPGTKNLFGTDASGGNLIAVNPTTGSGTVIGSIGIGPVPSLAVDPTTGIMYGGTGAGLPEVYKISKNTGVATFVGDTGLGFAAVSAMDFRADGMLFASVNIAGDGGTGADHLAVIDKSTGIATVKGPFGTCTDVEIPSDGGGSCTLEGMEAITFDSSGKLFGATSSQRGAQEPALYKINTSTGHATFIAFIVDGGGEPPSGGVISLQFGCDGTLYGGTATAVSPATDGGNLIKINPSTGVFSTVGKATSGTSLGALAFKDPCPTEAPPPPKELPEFDTCTLAQQPEDPISMNSVRSGKIVKTIHAEKQIFSCSLEQGSIPVTVDVTIIAEIFEDMNAQSSIMKQAQVITCIKDSSGGQFIECGATTPSTDQVPVRNCSETAISHPQEMNTEVKGNIAKTVEAQKEVFLCDLDSSSPPELRVDLVTFTGIWEDLSNLPSNPVIKKDFLSFRCVTMIEEAEVQSCQFSNVSN